MISLKNTLKLMAKMVSPVGTVQAFAGSTIPSGWLLCNGQAVSRTTYAKLYSVIGTKYGSGDGSTTFNVPNLQGRVPVGVSSSDSDFDLADTGGEKTHTLIQAELPAHTHSVSTNGYHTHGYGNGSPKRAADGKYWNTCHGGSASTTTGAGSHSHTVNGGGSNDAHNNLQPYIALNYIICVG